MQLEKGLLPDKSPNTTGRNPRADMLEIKEFMNQHYHEPLSIRQLARLANISPKYFVDLFKKTYGQSAMDYLTDLRINRAKRYLVESNGKLRDIAKKVGYNDEFYFSRKFKKEVGVSPSAFVKNPKRRIAAYSPSIIGQLLALDIIPLAAPLVPKWTPYYYNTYRTEIILHLEFADPYTGPRFEENRIKLAQIRPDAIIGTDQLCSFEKAKLSNIAPSYFVSTEHSDWRDQFRLIARFLEREEKAERWIQSYERMVRLARIQIQKVVGDDTILVLRIYGQNMYAYCNRGMEDVLFKDLLLKAASWSAPCNRLLTLDQLGEINPDRILLAVCQETLSREYWLALQHTRAWCQLKATRRGHVYPIPSDPWFDYSAVSIQRMLDEALLLFTGIYPNALPDNVHVNHY